MTTKLHLYDPGMDAKTVEFETVEAALHSLGEPDAHKPYTDALVSTGGRVTHTAKRPVGEAAWAVKERPLKAKS
jgi:hypothetical protein